jgi:hypothetical protein
MKKHISIIGSPLQVLFMFLASAGRSTEPSVAPATISGLASKQTRSIKTGPMPPPYSAEIGSPAGPESFYRIWPRRRTGELCLAGLNRLAQVAPTPIRVNEWNSAGRADVALIGEDSALVSWVGNGKEGLRILTRVVGADGQRSQASILWTSESGKSAGFPHLAKRGDEWLLAWMDATVPKRVRTAAIKMTGP